MNWMGDCDRLKCLIGELDGYAQVLSERVQQKEAELGLLLVQVATMGGAALRADGGQTSPVVLPECDLRIAPPRHAHDPVTSTVQRKLLSPLPTVRICDPTTSLGPVSVTEPIRVCSMSSPVGTLSPIERACSSGYSSSEESTITIIRALDDTVKPRTVRHVRFAPSRLSSSPHCARVSPPTEGADRGGECTRGSFFPTRFTVATLERQYTESGASTQQCAAASESECHRGGEIAAPSEVETGGDPNDIDTVHYVRRRVTSNRRPSTRLSASNASVELLISNNSAATCSSPGAKGRGRHAQCNIPRKRWRKSESRGVSAGTSASVSAARPRTAVVAEEEKEEGIDAGITLACGPTLFFE